MQAQSVQSEPAHRIEVLRDPEAKARLELFFYPDSVKRVVKIEEEELRKRLSLPRRLVVDSVPHPREHLDSFLQEQREFLEAYTRVGPTRGDDRGQRAQKDLEADNKQSPVGHQTVTETLTTTTEPAKPVEGELVTDDERAVTARIDVTGILRRHGWGINKKAKEPYTAYYVELYADEYGGARRRIWGNDLAQAIENADARNGDRIRVKQTGTMDIEVKLADGSIKQTRKKIFAIEILGNREV